MSWNVPRDVRRDASRPAGRWTEARRIERLGVMGLRGAGDAAKEAMAVLEGTASADAVGEALANVLDRLHAALSEPTIAAAAADRGGAETAQKLSDAASALRGAVQSGANKPGTPAETQWLNLLDGLVVQHVRSARDAAESASKELADPALLEAFKLERLYPSRGKGKKEGGGGGPTGE